MEKRIKHLEMIQEIIKRMAGNSFLLRGWSITLTAAISTLFFSTTSIDTKPYLILTALFLIFVFWTLDAYYLSQERAYRKLYEEVRVKNENDIDFSMNAKKYLCGNGSWFSSMFSSVFLVFYGTATAVLLLVTSNFIGISFYIK